MTTVYTYDYEEGTDGANVPNNANGVVSKSGSPKYMSLSAIHNSMGWRSPSATGGGKLIYANPNTAGSTGSIYARMVTFDTSKGSYNLLELRSTSGGSIASIQIGTAGNIKLVNDYADTGSVDSGSVNIALNVPFRVDWQQTWNSTTQTLTFTAKLFYGSNDEGAIADDTITGSFVTTSPDRVGIGNATAGADVDFDTLRLYDDVSAWPLPFQPPSGASHTYEYEEGTNGQSVSAGLNGVLAVAGSPFYASAAAMHGTLGIESDAAAGGRLEYSNNTPASTGSLYVSVADRDGSVDLVAFRTSTGSNVAKIQVGSAGTFNIVDSNGQRVTGSTATIVLGEPFRLDWQKTYTSGNITITFKIFQGDNWEWVTADDTVTATFTTGSPDRTAVGDGTPGADMYFDTFRQWDNADAWPDPYNPTEPPPPPTNPTQVYSWLGDPTQDGFVVVSLTDGCTYVQLAYSTDASMFGAQFTTGVAPDADGYVRHVVTGLQANTKYYYQLWDTKVGGSAAAFGVISGARTTPLAGRPANFNVAFGSCTQGNSVISSAVDDIVSFDPVFFVHLGDFHYKGITSTKPQSHTRGWAAQIASAAGYKNLVQNVPIHYAISDHEYSGQNGDTYQSDTIRALHTAYMQAVPFHQLADQNPMPGGLYRSWVVGRVRFILIDCRSLDRSPGAAQDPGDGSKTYLGLAQKTWLKQQLLQPEPLKVILSDTVWPGVAATPPAADEIDKWMAYPTERSEIAQFINDNNLNVEFWCGDTHMIATDKTHNTWGGFPVLLSSPLDQKGFSHDIDAYFDQSFYNENWSRGSLPPGQHYPPCAQYMRVMIQDDGKNITRTAMAWVTPFADGSVEPGAGSVMFTDVVTWFAPAMATVYKNNPIMRWNGQKITDHNRAPLDAQVTRIENSQRTASGTLRKYTVAKKRSWSTSWENVPHTNNIDGSGTVDGGMAGQDIKNFYDSTDGPFELDLYYGDGSYESVTVMFSDFQHSVEKRGTVDWWNISVTMEEV